MIKTLQKVLLATTSVIALLTVVGFVVATQSATAATPRPDPDRLEAHQALCKAFHDDIIAVYGNPTNKKLYRDNCASPATTEVMDKFVENICAVYGPYPGNKKLKAECEDYAALVPIKPQVDPASCAADPTQTGCDGVSRADECKANACDLVEKYVNPAVNLVSGIFTLIAVISLMLGGIQYASSAGDAQKVTAAKKRISNTIYAIIAYAFLFTFLQWLIPGGLFRN